METTRPCPMATELAVRMRAARDEITTRWLERIAERVRTPTDPEFPMEALLGHAPILIDGIADYVENPIDEFTADVPVIAKAMELGELRFTQGFDASEILKEYEVLGGVVYSYAARVASESRRECSAGELLACGHRIYRAISVIEQVTTAHYLRSLLERVGEREDRLRRFRRMITHELKNRVGATLGAGQLLQEEWLGDQERQRFAGMVADNAQAIQKVLENLTVLSRLDGERRRQRNIMLREIVKDVFRQLRELANARGVTLRVADGLPETEVNASAVELCLSNYLSNAIKYSDEASSDRWAEVTGRVEEPQDDDGTAELVIRVRDNGLGVPRDARDRLFERFFRAHTETVRREGTGLGLNLVRETVASLGGRAWAEFDGGPGSVFAFSLPCRRSADAAGNGVSGSAGAATRDDRPRRAEARATASD